MRQDGDLAEGSSERIWDKGSYREELELSSSVYSGSLEVEVEDKWPDQKKQKRRSRMP